MNYNIQLSDSEINHLLGLIEENERSGIYYGNRLVYIDRQRRIEKKLLDAQLKSYDQ